MILNWHDKTFNELSNKELYDILALRTEVFVVEQNCPYQECDGKDIEAVHFYGEVDQEVVAYVRILPPGIDYETPAIGRVVTGEAIRGKGLGYELMEEALKCSEKHFNTPSVTISAQEHLEKYYNKLGFERASEMYLEDDIPHIKMIKN